MEPLRCLDLFCGRGGWTKGFLKEGFHVEGIDIKPFPSYPGKFRQDNVCLVSGQWYRGFHVVVGSPPCRNFTITRNLHKQWKKPLNISEGLKLVAHFFRMVDEIRPRFWLMENVPLLRHYLLLKPKVTAYLGYPRRMRRCFWGRFPPFFIKQSPRKLVRDELHGGARSEIPFPIAHEFAKACKEALLHA